MAEGNMRVRMRFGAAMVAAALLGAGVAPAAAQKSADTLRIAMRDALPNIDPYYNNLRTGIVMHHHGWDTLVYRNPDTFKIEPLLATEWKFVDPTTLDFTLRPGVKFHDGSPLTADDVVYTLNIAADPASRVSTPANYNWIDKAEKTGELSVRVKLKRPSPAALEYFALAIPIYPKAYREKVGPEGYAKAPVGAGPYKMTKVEPGVSVDFERFEDYWAGSPKGKPAIKKISVRFVPDATTEMTELLAGRVDWIWNLNPDQFDNVNKLPHLQAVRKESMRVGYLSLDAAGRTGADNPLTKLKVRQAIWHAIDRKTIADKLVTGGSRVPAAPCFPPQFGCDGEIAVLYDYDPAKAKQLLAEAGYPNGFEVELTSYVLPQWGAAIQNYLQVVGIRAKLNQMQVAAVTQRAKAGELRAYLGSWGSFSINDVSAILPNFFDGGADDYARDADV
jgi:peptide/nickel transport system substrate-binding protein